MTAEPQLRRPQPQQERWRHRIRLGRRQEWSVYVSAALLVVSGVLWLLFHHYVRVDSEFGPRPHPLEYAWLRLHGAAGMLFLVVVGALLPVHVRHAWEQRRNFASGLVLALLIGVLVLSGYLLYYFASEGIKPVASLVHWVIGLVFVAGLAWHALAGRRLQRSDETRRLKLQRPPDWLA